MPINSQAPIEVTAFSWVPQPAQGLVKDLRVRWALEEADLDYRIRLIGMDRPAGYAKEQPFCQVPCIREGEVQLFESGAILQYIGEKSDKLLPRETQAKYRAIQWTYAALNSVEPFVQIRVLLEGFWAEREWAKPSMPTFDELARLRLGQVGEWLGDREWLEGDRFTIGDLMMVSVLRIGDRRGLLDDRPSLKAYMKRGEARPAFKQALQDQLATFREHEPQGEAA